MRLSQSHLRWLLTAFGCLHDIKFSPECQIKASGFSRTLGRAIPTIGHRSLCLQNSLQSSAKGFVIENTILTKPHQCWKKWANAAISRPGTAHSDTPARKHEGRAAECREHPCSP